MDGNLIIIKDLVTQKWNVALCPLMKTLKGMQLQNPYPPPQKKSPSYMYTSIHGTHDLKQKWKLSNKRRLIRMPLYNICIMVINQIK